MSAELLFKDYVAFKENKNYLTEDVPEHIDGFFNEILSNSALIVSIL